MVFQTIFCCNTSIVALIESTTVSLINLPKVGYEVASLLLDNMAKVNRAWNTREGQVFSLIVSMSKEEIDKKNE